MAKYDPLRDYLKRQRADEIELTFAEIERRIGAMLPKSANQAQWWAGVADAGAGSVQGQAWKSVGFDAVLIAGKDRVLFRKTRS